MHSVEDAQAQSIIEENGQDLLDATNDPDVEDAERSVRSPVMTLAKIIEIRDELFADDVEIDCLTERYSSA